MKKILLLLAIMIGSISMINAANPYAKPRQYFGVRGGLAVSNGGTNCYDWNTMFTVGASYAHRITKHPIYIETGLWVNTYYTDFDSDTWGVAFKIPVMGSYRFAFGSKKEMSIAPYFGPYFAVTSGFDAEYNDNFDFGFRLGAAYTWKKLYATVGMDFGAINRRYDDVYHGSRNPYLGPTFSAFVAVGYNFICK